jgi:capsid protein
MGKIRELLRLGPSKSELQSQLNQSENINEQLANHITAHSGQSFGHHHRGTGRRGDGSKYTNGFAGSGSSIHYNHFLLRQNARTAEYDVPQLKAIKNRFADTIVDVGLKLESTPKFELLGISREEAERWGSMVDEGFDAWASSKDSDYTGINNFYQNQHMYHGWQHRDNDMFTRLHYSSRKDLISPLQIQFIDPDQIRGDAITTTYGFQFSQINDGDGITRDSHGRETGYKIWVQKKDGKIDPVTIPAKSQKTGRKLMLHGFKPEFAGQGRGFSGYAHALQNFQKLTDFELSHIQKAIAQSSIMGAVTPSDFADASNPLESSLTRQGVGPSRATSGDNPQPDPGISAGTTAENLEFCEKPEATNRAPGAVLLTQLKKGEKLDTIMNTAPVTSYPEFVDSFVSYLSASMSMPLEVLLMKFGNNFSASRATLILFWRVGQIWIQEMKADLLDPIKEAWLSEEIAAGRISAPGWSDPRLRAAWLSCRWRGAPMPNIDPGKMAKANRDNIIMGAQTLDDTARDNNNSNGKSNRAKLAREIEELPEEVKASLLKTGGGGQGGR